MPTTPSTIAEERKEREERGLQEVLGAPDPCFAMATRFARLRVTTGGQPFVTEGSHRLPSMHVGSKTIECICTLLEHSVDPNTVSLVSTLRHEIARNEPRVLVLEDLADRIHDSLMAHSKPLPKGPKRYK